MFSIQKSPLPENALLAKYVREGYYTDCYMTEVAGTVSHAEYVAAFYTTWLFKLERFILKWAVKKPSTDSEARKLSAGELDRFAAWYVEGRGDNQILMCDFRDRTRSWLMVSPATVEGGPGTQLYFGSAVVPIADSETGAESLGGGFSALIGFHKVYSEALLFSARSRLASQ